jgi:hypothetical protein
MKITGYLSEFSLGEMFRFLAQGRKTGCLTIKPVETGEEMTALPLASAYYTFFHHGNIVAATTSLDHQELQRLIAKRGWLRISTIQKLAQLCPPRTALGLFLKTQGALDGEQLQLLFKQQVLTPIPHLFSIKDGWFEFDANHPLPYAEMTGLTASPMEITLAGLRLLRDWTPLLDKLPLPSSTVVSLLQGELPHHLSRSEWQVWEHIDGTLSIEQIAARLNQSVLDIQKICFRFMVVGMVEEVAAITTVDAVATRPEHEMDALPITEISHSFLQGLLTFLKGKKDAA